MNSAIKRKGVIEAPPRGSFAGSFIILLVVGVISVAPVLPRSFGMVSFIALLLLLSAAIIKRQYLAVHLSTLFALLFMTYLPGPSLRTWPFKTLVPLVIYGLIIMAIPPLRRSTNWVKTGELDAKVKRLVIATAILSAVRPLLLSAGSYCSNPIYGIISRWSPHYPYGHIQSSEQVLRY